jgi:hypothetical protein
MWIGQQGGAADVAMLAMLQLRQCEELKAINYKVIMQVHDEVILEGPEEHREKALELTRRHMQFPFPVKNPEYDPKVEGSRRFENFGKSYSIVDLLVDGSADYSWYDAK